MLTNIVDRVHYNRILIVTTNKGEVMEQLELPLKFKPYTYEDLSDIQKKDYWHTNYIIQTNRIERAERRLKKFLTSRDWGDTELHGINCNDTRDAIKDILKGLVEEI